LGVFFTYNYEPNWGPILISLGIFAIALTISRQTGKMTGDIAKSSLYETIGEFEDRRLNIRIKNNLILFKRNKDNVKDYAGSESEKVDKQELIIYASYSLWKCVTYLNRALIYKRYFDDKEEDKLIHQVDNLYIDICDSTKILGKLFDNEVVKHLTNMYDLIFKLERFNRQKSINDEFRRERILSNLKYLKGLINYTTDFKRCDIVPRVIYVKENKQTEKKKSKSKPKSKP